MAKTTRISRTRLERLRLGIPLFLLALESGLPISTLSLSERGYKELSAEQEKLRRQALRRIDERRSLASAR
jgi:hypothetical protein